jgi:hypothetical protein
MSFKGNQVRSAGTIFVGTWFALTGLVEVILFLILRPDFGLEMPRLMGRGVAPVDNPPCEDASE